MSEELKRKLYDYEETPPETTWNKIAAALNEEIDAEFSQKLYEAEVKPPVRVWNKIVDALEEDIQEQYPAKLYNLEVAPPADAWQKISAALEEERELPRIPSKRKIAPFVRYAVAACLLGVIAFGTVKLISRNSTDQPVTKTVVPQNTPSNVQPEQNSSAQTTPALTNNLPTETKALAGPNTAIARRKSSRYMVQKVHSSPMAANSAADNFQQASLSGNIPGSNSWLSDADRYLMFMNPDGYLIRMSKKLAEALCCFYTNGNSEEYKQCQEQIKKWRDKIAQSPASSSPNNFMDVLDIIKRVQDKEL